MARPDPEQEENPQAHCKPLVSCPDTQLPGEETVEPSGGAEKSVGYGPMYLLWDYWSATAGRPHVNSWGHSVLLPHTLQPQKHTRVSHSASQIE